MNVLKELTFAAVPRENSLSHRQKRRNKLIAHLREQLAMVEAEDDGRIHIVKKRRWERTGDRRYHQLLSIVAVTRAKQPTVRKD